MYEPKILGFLCTWCSYTGADTAGISRLKYPGNMRAVRVPCSGRVSPELIMHAFDQGADGVLVLGCHLGECHYENGNHRTAKRLPILHSLLSFAGLEPERLRLDWVSASEGERFARIVNEFTETVRGLGPARWRLSAGWRQVGDLQEASQLHRVPGPRNFQTDQRPTGIRSHNQEQADYRSLETGHYISSIQAKARELLETSQVECVIGYEVGPYGRTRPAFIRQPSEVERLVWNDACTHNLTNYLRDKLHSGSPGESRKVAVVVKPCDSRAINMLLAENQFTREQVHVIGVVCPGIRDTRSGNGSSGAGGRHSINAGALPAPDLSSPHLQLRCQSCSERTPVLYDTLIGEAGELPVLSAERDDLGLCSDEIGRLQSLSPLERAEFWLAQFDRCIRCYACRQACPLCNCPTCLYERDDSLWVGMGIGLSEKRAFHLGRAYHLAGRCIGCDECERACPVNLPLSLLNRMLAREMEAVFGHRAGFAATPSPFVTVLGGEEA